ncbi:ribosome recycling factor [Candidatus Uhrbacteria bacterium]|nr:ribosome recycling factor [Candidatus Uhrbacteria bacterium]
MSNYIQEAEQGFEQALEHFAKELKNLRTNRATAELVEDVRVEAYGQNMELKGVASITIPDAKTIQIEPWDKNLVKDIEKALMGSGLGITPKVAGTSIHLNLPPMTEENRKELVKLIGQKEEQARISIRNLREEVRDQIVKDEKAKTISEDEKYQAQEKLDEVVGKYNKKIEEIAKEKEKDVMTI